MVAHVVENVVAYTKQRPSLVVRWILPYYDVRRKEQAKWFPEPEVFAQAQRTSLLVVVGNGPTYTVANDLFRARRSRVFSVPEAFAVTKSWLVAPFGAVGYTGDVQRWPQAKFFPEQEVFPQAATRSPRVVTDYSQGNADIFKGQDTYGWPPPPAPEYWSPEGRGTRTILQNFVAYDFAHDVIGRRPQAKYFGEPETFTRIQQPITIQAISYTYNAAADVTRLQRQTKYFEEPATFWRQSQPITGNALFVFPVYNPATDVTRLRRQAQSFVEPEMYFRPTPNGPYVVIGFPILTGFRCQAVTSGWYNGLYYQPGDVFDIAFAHDFSDSTVNYAGPHAGTQEYGWMMKVPSTTPLLFQRSAQPVPLFPVIDPVPPKRFVY